MLGSPLKKIDFVQQAALGQVWTPPQIAKQMVIIALKALGGKQPNLMLDPACGPATFEKALAQTKLRPKQLLAIDIDEVMSADTNKQIKTLGLKGKALCSDYLFQADLTGKADLIIMNPPYIRQELISLKTKSSLESNKLNIKIDKRANLLAYFLVKAACDLKAGGILCAIVYDGALQTNYGRKLLNELSRHMEQISCESITAPFHDVLVDANILVMRRREKSVCAKVSLIQKKRIPDGRSKLEDLLLSRRGGGLPNRKAFLANPDDLFFKCSSPLFIKQAQNSSIVIDHADTRAYLLAENFNNSGFLNWIQERLKDFGLSSKLAHQRPVSGPILFNYYVRSSPRHLINPSGIPVADNFYVSHPIGDFPMEAAWLLLNSRGFTDPILEAGRSQGSGLIKLQLYEYKSAIIPDWRQLSVGATREIRKEARKLIHARADLETIRQTANAVYETLF